ncbi:MAG TPA: ABC transporter substrate-binding protein [Acidimicrobiia bacterium]|nr:ABC transporter substrate-binding protein [Acidimicrobiia bacterium]
MTRARRLPGLVLLLVAVTAAGACKAETPRPSTASGEAAETTSSTGAPSGAGAGGGGEAAAAPTSSDGPAITLGYSAWPGWFVWDVAEKKGFFDKEGVKVKLTYFSDYTTCLQAMTAGKLDANSQTLNDTLLGVTSGSAQISVIENDNSFGNDAIIVKDSIKTIEDLKGKKVGAEEGVVDHFLLLQGLASKGMKETDVQFRNLPTDAAAAAFASGQIDAVGVFAPFTVQALKRPGSHVLFSSKDYPGTISDHLVVTPRLIKDRKADVQKLVNAWYGTLDWIKANPTDAGAIMAEHAQLKPEEYAALADGTKLFSPAEAIKGYTGQDATDLTAMFWQVNDFLLGTGLIKSRASLDGLYDPSFTKAYAAAHGG